MKAFSVNLRFPRKRPYRGGRKASISTLLTSLLVTLLLGGIWYYFALPAINIKSMGFWLFVGGLLVLYVLVLTGLAAGKGERVSVKIPLRILAAMFVIVALAMLFGLRIWHAHAYSKILKVDQGKIQDIPSVEGTSSIALMDTASAEKLGDREIGSLTDVVSQFNVGDYVQIDYKAAPVKVSALQYEGFFKWLGNRKEGIPGYVMVNPVSMSADYLALSEGMVYVPSAYFQEDLMRHIRFAYPTAILGNLHFEIDEEGRPWYIASEFDHSISLFGGVKVKGAILVDPLSGKMEKLAAKDIPRWADVIYPGNLIIDQFNDSAQLHKGFINSIIGQVDCKRTTTVDFKDSEGEVISKADYGYIAKDGDVWIFTGVTSVNGDASNIAFIMANERTSETKYITCSGADEGSAMKSAEGEVQEKGYHASFPSLINVDDTPTYIMVLKDDNGLVKMYACVNVAQYNMVVTSSSQKGAIDQYRRLLKGEITADQANSQEEEKADTSKYKKEKVKVEKLEKIDLGGNTFLYIVTDKGVYHAKYIDVIDMIRVKEGDTITIRTDGEKFLFEQEKKSAE